MTDFTQTKIVKYIVHQIGSKILKEGCKLSPNQSEVGKKEEFLLKFFLSPFSGIEHIYRFSHESSIELNETFATIKNIFEDKASFIENSQTLAKYLYNISDHPKIKASDFYVVFFNDCIINGEVIDAVGIFTTNERNYFGQISKNNNNFDIQFKEGIAMNDIKKGCIVYNIKETDGYRIQLFENKKDKNTKYFTEDFLGIKPVREEYFYTEKIINVFKEFINEKDYDFSVIEKTALKDKALQYLRSNEEFEINDFSQEILSNDETTNLFREALIEYENENDILIPGSFEISEEAVKKNKKHFKSVIKLDKNFHIYIHGNREFVEAGYDVERGQGYYKLYFNEEK